MGSILIRYSKRVASFFSPFLFYFFIFMSLLLSILVIKKCHRIHFKMLKTAIMCFFLMRLAQGNVLQQSDDVYPGDNYADLYPGKAYATSEWIYSKGLKCYAENAFKVNRDVYWSSWGNPDLPVAIWYQFEKPKRVIKMKFEEVYRLPAGSIYEVFASDEYGNCGKKKFQTLLASGTAQQFAAGKEFSNEKSYLCYGVRTYKLNSSWKVVALKRIELRIEDINECDKNTCKNGGTCTNNDGSYSCRCPNLWRGKNCDKVMKCFGEICYPVTDTEN